MTTALGIAFLVVAYSLLSIALHEMTHYIVAAYYRRQPEIDFVGLAVYWRSEGARDKPDDVIAAAPVLLGMAVLPLFTAGISDGLTTMDLVRHWAWILYTIPVPILGVGASYADWQGVRGLFERGRAKEMIWK